MSRDDAVAGSAPSRLARKLGSGDAVIIGLGAMVGAGIFAALAPAARAAGSGLLLGLVIAGFVAYCNATSSAALAALHPESGGAYVYGRKRLGHAWGFLAGWCFIVGKLASCAAMALTFASYAAPTFERPLAVVAVALATAVNYLGVAKTALVTRVIVAFVLACLAFVVFASVFGGSAVAGRAVPSLQGGWGGILQSAGFLFFAFAGYARIATLGEEVVAPERTIRRAIPVALGIALVVYAVVAISALAAVGAEAIATTPTPLAAAVAGGRFAPGVPIVRIGAAVASLGVLLSLLAGISRTTFAMAGNGDLPRSLAHVHPRHRVPDHAEVAAGVIVSIIVVSADVANAIGVSSFAVLLYYAIANAAAMTLGADQRRATIVLPLAGLTGCVLIASSLPLVAVVAGVVIVSSGAAAYGVRLRSARETSTKSR
ncbi:MAG TPA: amino acid permease [Casimicrobiaceae bacterium]|nr:amino acid permease [Casimicrobiaceae bacterium]